jgi:uncharacterized RDD family membrane protein YckC
MENDSERERALERRQLARERRAARRPAKKRRREKSSEEPLPPTFDPLPEAINPYAPPREEDSQQRRRKRDRFVGASKGKRLGNFLIDNVVMSVASGIAGAVLALGGSAEFLLNPLLSYGFGLLVHCGYYLVTEGTSGRTVGKLLTGTKVVTEDGGRPAFGAILLRSLIRLIPFEPFSFLGPQLTGWHDRWSNTRVVEIRL